jgi:hypothetical protein
MIIKIRTKNRITSLTTLGRVRAMRRRSVAMKNLITFAIPSILCISFFLSCSQSPKTETHAYLELTLKNETGELIDETAIVLGTNRCTSGILGVDAAKTYLGWQKPVGSNATVQWRDGRQTAREAHVSLVDVYNPNLDGKLIFTIMPTNAPTNAVVRFQQIDRNRSRP